MKTKINRWSLKSAAVFLSIIGLTLSASASFAQITVTPGTGGPYSTLRAAFARINDGTHTGGIDGVITISVIANTDPTETMPAVLNASGMGSASYESISITPNGAWTITGNVAGPLIDLRGADNVTIDGSNASGASLTISNTNFGTISGTSTIRFVNGATNNKVTYCNIEGSALVPLLPLVPTILPPVPPYPEGGTIVFSTDAVTAGGNDDNTISFCNIRPAGNRRPVTAILGLGSINTAGIRNSGVRIENNNIFDFFGNGTSSSVAGILVFSGNTNWIISNNRIYQTAARAFAVPATTAVAYTGITLNTIDSRTPLPGPGACMITGNTIGFENSTGTGTTKISGGRNVFRGINAVRVDDTTQTTIIQGNTISGIEQTTTSPGAAFIAVSMPGVAGAHTAIAGFVDYKVTDNTIGSLDGDSSLPSTIVVNSSSTTVVFPSVAGIVHRTRHNSNISNNNIGAITIRQNQGMGSAVGFTGILVSRIKSARKTTIVNNIIGGNGAGAITDMHRGNYLMYGILNEYAHGIITGNTVCNMISNSTQTGLRVVGLRYTASQGDPNTISQNTIHSLRNDSGAAGNSVYGIHLGLYTKSNRIERNFVHSLSMKAATGALIGIHAGFLQGNTKAIYWNNMVRLGIDSEGEPVSAGLAVTGIREQDSGITNGENSFLFNSVYVSGSGTGEADSYAFYSNKVNLPRNPRFYRNNIFWNERSSASGPGKNYAIRVSGTARPLTGLTSDFNDLRASGLGGTIGLFNGMNHETLQEWQNVTGLDVNSIDDDPLFEFPDDPAGTLHVKPETPVRARGTPISITTDFDGDSRLPAPPDIGADEVICTTTTVVSNPMAITILDDANATPYGTGIPVAGLGQISTIPGSVQVTINGFSHTSSDDVGMVLVGPTNAALLLQDFAGYEADMVNVPYTFSDTGAMRLPDMTAWAAGTYKPTNYYYPLDVFPEVVAYDNPGPVPTGTPTFASFASVFGGTNPNGEWKLYVRDFARQDTGLIAGGWTLTITTDIACASPTPSATPMPTPPAAPTPVATPTATPAAISTSLATPAPVVTPTPTLAPSPASTPAVTATPTPIPATQTINLSTRMRVRTGDHVAIGGFIIAGSDLKHVLIRAIGPSLIQSGVPDALADPVLELHGPGGFGTITNNNWRDAQEAEIQATGIPPINNLESAIDASLAPGAYTAIVRGNGDTSGVALVEVYDLNEGVASKLANLSTRAFVSTGDNIVIAGFLLSNNATDDRIAVRGIGPSLAVLGVPNAMADPTLELRNSNGALLVANNDWQDNPEQAAELAGAGLAPTSQLESGIAATLPPGLYTALLAGLNNGSGVGLVEVYDLGAP